MDPLCLIHIIASNSICSVLFGQRYDYKDKVLSFIINSLKENAQIANGAWAAVSSYGAMTIFMMRLLQLKAIHDDHYLSISVDL